MCEELIWLEYLLSLPPEDSGIILRGLSNLGNYETFIAQRDYADQKNMGDLGFPSGTEERLREASEKATTEIETLARKLQWRRRKGQLLPSTKSLADAIGRSTMYSFLYHATSRIVHFSVPELARRVWGGPGQMKVGSNTFEPVLGTRSHCTGVVGYSHRPS